MVQLVKDLISFLAYIFITPFYRKRNVVLVYHSIGDIDPSSDPQKINVTPERFEEQMRYLSTCGRSYLLTFDDGFENVYTNAFPLLKRYGARSILFITTDFIDSRLGSDRLFNNAQPLRPLTWAQVKDMSSCGVEIGSHSCTHKTMSDLDEKSASHEASASRERIRDMVGCDVRYFSYPFGSRRSFNKATERLLRDAGYSKAFTNIMGMDNSEEEPFVARRIRVYGTDNIFRFKMKVSGAYNWVDHLPGILVKNKLKS
ncbi:MAG: polysaccharide deacetylase family protein [Candidatus Omnitrophica bacterium]|nr:polysaccharide deacetylase family protein [Candidatus Omnitrophota bacterium]